MNKKNDYKNAEALGQIKTMPETVEIAVQESELTAVISSPEEFRMAIGQAQMEGEDFVEVTPELFKYLLKKSKSKYITYGDPGVKVFLAGTREEIERVERMSAEAFHDYQGRKNLADANK